MTGGSGAVGLSRDAGALVVAITGELDLANAPGFEAEIRAALDGTAWVIIDLSGIEYFDSSGVRMLDHVAEAVEERGAGLVVVSPTGGRARQILRICAFREDLLVERLDEALERAGSR